MKNPAKLVLLALYGHTEEKLDKEVEEQKKRIEERRKDRVRQRMQIEADILSGKKNSGAHCREDGWP